ncbi:MAG TPA: hypothetical protein VGG72_02250 [Bryobacteraceae bacterium]
MFLYPVVEILGERRASFLAGFCGLAELFGLSFHIAAFDCSLKPGFSFRLGLISGFLNVTQREGPDALAVRSDFTPDSAVVKFVFLDREPNRLGRRVLGWKSRLGNLDALAVRIPTAKKHVTPADAALPLLFENASCHLFPDARVMTVTSEGPAEATSLARS